MHRLSHSHALLRNKLVVCMHKKAILLTHEEVLMSLFCQIGVSLYRVNIVFSNPVLPDTR